ncbi:MAG TPA: hypothetical protein VK963_00925 [Candidatus Saccharimonadales bacterium]|nr:hypothetical protein [Candidatus Saccharimonadales bacterium]
MSKYTYQNTSDQELMLVGFGVVAGGGTIETDDIIENPNFKLVSGNSSDEPTHAPTTQTPAPVPSVQVQEKTEDGK